MNEEGKGVAISTKVDLEIQSLFGITVIAHPGQFDAFLSVFLICKDFGGIFWAFKDFLGFFLGANQHKSRPRNTIDLWNCSFCQPLTI